MPQYYHLISGIRSAPFVSHGTAVLNPVVAKSSPGQRKPVAQG